MYTLVLKLTVYSRSESHVFARNPLEAASRPWVLDLWGASQLYTITITAYNDTGRTYLFTVLYIPTYSNPKPSRFSMPFLPPIPFPPPIGLFLSTHEPTRP